MKVQSIWKLTYDPASAAIVMLDFGDYMEEELDFPLSRGVQVIPLVNGTAPFLRVTGNAAVQIKVARYQTVAAYGSWGADIAAREEVMDKLIAFAATDKKILRVQLNTFTDHYWEFANCVVSGVETRRILESPVGRVLSVFSLTCTGLSKKNGTP